MKPFVASLDNYELNILDISDNVQSSLVRHEFLNTDGAIINNFGNRAREIRFKAYFFGPATLPVAGNVSANYSNHYYFIQDVSDSSVQHTLVHPKYGTLLGYVDSLTIVHNDTQDYVEIEIAFVENNILDESFTYDTESIDELIAQEQVKLRNNVLGKMKKGMSAVGQLLDKAIKFDQNMNSQFAKLTAPARDFIQQADAACSKFDRLLNTVTQPIDSIESAVDLAFDVPGRILTSITHAIDRVVYSLASLSKAPSTMADAIVAEIGHMGDAITGSHADFYHKHIRALGAGQVAQVCAKSYKQDQVATDTAKAVEKTPAFDLAGRRISNVPTIAVMSVGDVEAILATTRNMIQEVLLDDRENENLLKMAADLATYADDVKLNKKKVIVINTNNVPLHVLCAQYGLSYHAADRVRALNPGVHNPTFTSGNVSIYAD